MTRLDGRSELWLRRFHPPPESGARLICFPHAGGSATYFLPLSAALSTSVDVLGVQYPGRQDRRSERAIGDMAALADEVFGVMRSLADRPLAFFGHSMGAVLAFEVARRFADEAAQVPLALLVSGRRAPSIHRNDQLHRKSDAVLVAEIKRLSGTDASLLADDEVRQMVLPAIRSDYRATETYHYRPGPKLSCPISAFVGDSDPRVTVDEAQAWRHHTAAGFRCRVFAGGHFYLNGQHADVVNAISEDIAAARRDGAGARAKGS